MTRFVFFLFLCIRFLMHAEAGAADKRIQSTSDTQRLKWYEDHKAMRETSLFRNLEWRFVGPEIMSGRVTDVAVVPGKPFSFYMAAASGGVWYTDNEGTTWNPVFEDAASMSIGDIAVDPLNPEVVWVGTGESNIFRSSMAGTGVYKSEDSGKTWRHLGLEGTHHIGRVVIDPKNTDVVYVAASGHEYTPNKERGVYRTRDGGNTWTRVLYINENTGVVDLAMDPENSDILYAVAWDRIRRPWSDPLPGAEDAVYKTTDGGETWKKAVQGLPGMEKVGRMGIDVCQSQPNILYLIMDNHHPRRMPEEGELDPYGRLRTEPVIRGAEIYRSDDRAETWTRVSEDAPVMERLFATYGWVFGQVRVDPNDPDVVYALGVPMLKSTDGGRTFRELDYRGLHADHHALWIDPDNSDYLINGNDGGINISYDGGETWKNFMGPGVVQFYNVAVDSATPFRIYGSIQDNGSYRGPVTHSPGRDPEWEWENIPGGEASYLAVDPADMNVLYNESFYGRIRRSEWKDGRWHTVSITPEAAEGEPRLRGQWLAPFILSPHNSSILYHGMQAVFRSMNRGDTWERISPDLTWNDPAEQGNISYATLTSLSESPLKFGLLYAGTDDGRVHVTRDGGRHWEPVMKGLPYKKWVSRVVASAFDEGTVYLTLNGKRDNDFNDYMYRSVDYGKTWTDISANIPGGPVNVIFEDPKNPRVLYAGTDLGAYVTVNGGMEWHVLSNGLPVTYVHDLLVHSRERMLVAGTHGRGAWVMDIAPIQNMTPDILEKAMHLFPVEAGVLPVSRQSWARNTGTPVTILYYLEEPARVTLEIRDAADKILRTLPATGDRGINRVVWDLTPEEPGDEGAGEGEIRYVEPGTVHLVIHAGSETREQAIEVKPHPER